MFPYKISSLRSATQPTTLVVNSLKRSAVIGLVTLLVLMQPAKAQTASPVSANALTASGSGVKSSVPDSYKVHAYVNQTGKLYLIVDNPENLRYKILVADQKNRAIYEEFTNHNQYRRRLDLSALPENSYQVVVLVNNTSIRYSIKKQDSQFAYSLQSQSATDPAMDVPPRQTSIPAQVPITLD
ncbi:hypothetical protein [Spirosoma sp.]|uniref:hypothetical protein n=1 Tax=Spirosoma sp. TaxID=1899569 RepID=UPI003B3B9656